MSADADQAAAVRDIRQQAAEQKREQQREHIELEGAARDLFLARHEDTFSLDVHGTEIEFYRPLDAGEVDFGDALDGETVDRIRHGSDLLDEFEARQRRVIEAAQGGDMSLSELLEESMDGTELMCRALAAHAVDESLTDYRVWRRLFRNDEVLSGVFEDFINEGGSEQTREKLDALDGLMSDSSF